LGPGEKGLGREATWILARHNFLILRRFDAQEGLDSGQSGGLSDGR